MRGRLNELCGADSHEHDQRPLSLPGGCIFIRGRAELDAPLPLRKLPARHVCAHGHLDLGAAECGFPLTYENERVPDEILVDDPAQRPAYPARAPEIAALAHLSSSLSICIALPK